MRFSFVLPAWKGKYLRESVSSILAQTYTDFELVIVDDCSPENLKEIVSSFHDARISYHRNKENIGGKDLVAQWNHCLQYAQGDYVILATDDDLYEPDFLGYFSGMIDKYPEADLLRSRIMQVSDDGDILSMDGYYKEHLTFAEYVYSMMHGMKSGIPQYIFKRETLLRKGGFVSFPFAWASDDASAIMMAENGVVISDKCLVKFRYCSGINITSNQSIMPGKTKAMLMYYEWMKGQLSIIKPVDAYTTYLYNNTVGNLSIAAKQMVMNQVGPTPFFMRLKCYGVILRGKEFYWRDKLSIILRTI